MSVVTIKTAETSEQVPSGAAMDRVVAPAGMGKRTKVAVGAAAGLAVLLAAFLFAPSGRTETVAAERLSISVVRKGRFEDYLPLRARVTPLVTVYLDAVEGGRVDKVLVEDGAMVEKGQLLAVLSNSDLQLNLLARQSEVAEQLNNMRNQELALVRTRLDNERAVIEAELAAQKALRQYELQRPLAERGFVAGRAFNDTRDEYETSKRRSAVLHAAQSTEERLQSSQLAQLRASAASLNSSLAIARANLDSLNLRAPVSGQLTAFSIQVGQSMNRGER
ncbi:MAG: HlyD family secretion protein, partial [Sphingomonadales bacterium]